MFLFGKDVEYHFYPLQDNENLKESDLAGIALTHVYVFSYTGGTPTRQTAADGTGSIQDITSWTREANNGFYFTVSAIDDPDPTSTVDCRTFWLGINFTLKNGGQVQTVLRALDLQRVTGHHKRVTVLLSDVQAEWPTILSYVRQPEVEAFISSALTDVKEELRNDGYQWALVYRPDKLSRAVLYRTLMKCVGSQVQKGGDKFLIRYDEFKKTQQAAIDTVVFEYDAHRRGSGDVQEKKGRSAFITS